MGQQEGDGSSLNAKGGNFEGHVLGDLPILNTPFTRFCETWMTHQKGPCAAFEMDFYRCAERVGRFRVEAECKRLLDDYMECRYQRKSCARYEAMQKERADQKKPFMEAPPKDALYIPTVPDH